MSRFFCCGKPKREYPDACRCQIPNQCICQASGYIPGYIPGQVPGYIPGHVPGQIPGHVPGQIPGNVYTNDGKFQPSKDPMKRVEGDYTQPTDPTHPIRMEEYRPPPDTINQRAFEIWLKSPPPIKNHHMMEKFQAHAKKLHGSKESFHQPTYVTSPKSSQLHRSKSFTSEKVSSKSQENLPSSEAETCFIPCRDKYGFSRKSNYELNKDTTDIEKDKRADTPDQNETLCVKSKRLSACCKIWILLILWIVFTVILMVKREKENHPEFAFIFKNAKIFNMVKNREPGNKLTVKLYNGPFMSDDNPEPTSYSMEVWIDAIMLNNANSSSKDFGVMDSNVKSVEEVSEKWVIPLKETKYSHSIIKEHVFTVKKLREAHILSVSMQGNLDSAMTFKMNYDWSPLNKTLGIIFAALILIGLYTLIIFEIVHRTFAAMYCSTLAIAALAILNQRPTMKEIVEWINVEILLLLFSLMIIVGILSETGIFDYLAVYAYKITHGNIWNLINCLFLFTCVVASLLDNVTTILLITPVAIRLCEIMDIVPIPVLIMMVIFSNIGGTMTPIGDPPNVIIATNPVVIDSGVNFGNFTLHMVTGLIFVILQTYIQFRFQYRNVGSLKNLEKKEFKDKIDEINQWKHFRNEFSKVHDPVVRPMDEKIIDLNKDLKKTLNNSQIDENVYQATLAELTEKYGIRDKNLLIKCTIVIAFIVILFFLHCLPIFQILSLGWTALLGAMLLLIIACRQDMEKILSKIQWATLLFFTALFVLMEALSRLGLISSIAKQAENIIMSVSESSRLTVAILIILWFSALTSAFIDNIPLTTMMIKIAIYLGYNSNLQLPLQPLMWALSFGACLGGNGTLIGASSNIVCAGVSEQHGHKISFGTFFKMGFPIMICSIGVATLYLTFCHVLFEWH